MLTDQQHPLTPPPELLQQWATEYWGNPGESIGEGEKYIATQAARWGADQELEACCEWLSAPCPSYGRELRAARRPKPPSLGEQALEAQQRVWKGSSTHADWELICTALEWLSAPCPSYGRELRAARRPKPPSLGEQALAALNEIEDRYAGPSTQEILIRRALERLQELENNDN